MTGGEPCPLPQWSPVNPGDFGTVEAVGDQGVIWRLWAVDEPTPDRRVGWWLAPRDALDEAVWISGPGSDTPSVPACV